VTERRIERERAQKPWASSTRSVEPLARAARIVPAPELTFDGIGELAAAKEELLTYACAATDPEVDARWGTFPPSGMLLIGVPGTGKQLLARALANHTGTSFVQVDVPRMVRDVLRGGPKTAEMVQKWERVLEVTPVFPEDIVAALGIHAALAEKRAGRPLFEEVDWQHVVGRAQIGSTGDWVRILHAVLRRKARGEVGGSPPPPVTTADLDSEVSRFDQAARRIKSSSGGNYV